MKLKINNNMRWPDAADHPTCTALTPYATPIVDPSQTTYGTVRSYGFDAGRGVPLAPQLVCLWRYAGAWAVGA